MGSMRNLGEGDKFPISEVPMTEKFPSEEIKSLAELIAAIRRCRAPQKLRESRPRRYGTRRSAPIAVQ